MEPWGILEELGKKAFYWFQQHRHPSGLIRDRTSANIASIAAVGYYLSMLPEGVQQGYLSSWDARAQARQTLDTLLSLPHRSGFFYHFLDWHSGERWQESEVSLLDSAICYNGCMVAQQAFPELTCRVDTLLGRVQWQEMCQGQRLYLGWTEEQGLYAPTDTAVNSEMAMPYLLAHACHVAPSWQFTTQADHLPLFASNIGCAWHAIPVLDELARSQAIRNRDFCRASAFRSYSMAEGGWWGISAGDGPQGYLAPCWEDTEGTVQPLAALATLPWLDLTSDLRNWQQSDTWNRVNSLDGLLAFNLDQNWVAADLLAIDLGAFALSLANKKNNLVRRLWSSHWLAQTALRSL